MLRLVTLAFLVAAALSLPTSSKDEIEAFREFLEKARPYTDGSLEENMKNVPWANPWENSGKFQGDIIVREEDIDDMVNDFAGNPSRNALATRSRLWPSNTIIFEFAGHTAAQQNTILGVMNMYESNTCVRFRRRTSERDFVRITNAGDGCYAHVGYFQNFGAHTHNLAPNGCMHPSIIFHEFGHNVGFNHMHQANVRNSWVSINWNNIISGMEHNFNLLANSNSDMLGLPYEYASNQHYEARAFSRNGLPTMVALQSGGNSMGQLNYITSWDINRINRLYNCAGAWSSEIRMEEANQPAFFWPSEDELQAMGARFAEEQERRIRMETPQEP